VLIKIGLLVFGVVILLAGLYPIWEAWRTRRRHDYRYRRH
jgi:hypothetical protein